jgi:DNA-binding Lrp family transcriptional regulator
MAFRSSLDQMLDLIAEHDISVVDALMVVLYRRGTRMPISQLALRLNMSREALTRRAARLRAMGLLPDDYPSTRSARR